MTDNNEFVEIQGTGEEISFSRKELDQLLNLAQKGINELIEMQREALVILLNYWEKIKEEQRGIGMNKSKLVLATGILTNREEIRDILKELPIEVLSKEDVGSKIYRYRRRWKYLEENAIKKARAIANEVEGMVMADDSGLFVDF